MTTEIVMSALDSAIQHQQPTDGLIIQTDLGSQYTRFEEQDANSYSRKSKPYDNSCIESFHAALKKEEVYQTTYHSYEETRLERFQYSEEWSDTRSDWLLDTQQLEEQARHQAQ